MWTDFHVYMQQIFYIVRLLHFTEDSQSGFAMSYKNRAYQVEAYGIWLLDQKTHVAADH